jgi:hypothetical protein
MFFLDEKYVFHAALVKNLSCTNSQGKLAGNMNKIPNNVWGKSILKVLSSEIDPAEIRLIR